jgi:hypothetical protein
MWCAQFIGRCMIEGVEKTINNQVKIGGRVGAWLSLLPDEGRGLFLGFGTYVGDEVPPNEGQTSLTAFLSGQRRTNPKILLDSGEVVWGCECWWGPEDEAKAEKAKLITVVEISMKDARAGKIPAGWESHLGVYKPAATHDDFWGSGSAKDKDFWS